MLSAGTLPSGESLRYGTKVQQAAKSRHYPPPGGLEDDLQQALE
jgi:hypothetical protein